jgi:hypothetical protein
VTDVLDMSTGRMSSMKTARWTPIASQALGLFVIATAIVRLSELLTLIATLASHAPPTQIRSDV